MLIPLEATGGYDFGPFITGAIILLAMIVCAIAFLITMCIKRFRSRSNPFLWITGGVTALGALWFAQYPVIAATEAAFFARDPGYAEQALPFEGRSIYVPNPCLLAYAAYGVNGSNGNAFLECGLPLADRLGDGSLDFFEIGEDPIRRFTLHRGDPACFRDRGDHDTVGGFMISVPLGFCVLGEEVAASQADHRIGMEFRDIPWPSSWRYTHFTLDRVADGTIIDRFDDWGGATHYGGDTPPPEARRTKATLARILTKVSDYRPYEETRIAEAQFLIDQPIDLDILRVALASRTNNHGVDVYYFTCRDDVLPHIDQDLQDRLTARTPRLFGKNLTFPQDCHPNLRQFRGGVAFDENGIGRKIE